MTTTLPILGSIVLLWWTIDNDNERDHREARNQAALQRDQAATSFKLEAARLVMAERTCAAAISKAAVLKTLFPNDLPDDFATPITRAFSDYRIERGRFVFAPAAGCPTPRPLSLEDVFGESFRQSFLP